MTTHADTRQSVLKHMLEQRRHAILDAARQEVREASEDTRLARAGEVRDEGDEGEVMLQDSIRFSLLNMKTEMVAGIDRALERLRDGRYGLCDRCGRDIAESRLRALPFAERCRPCEELREDVERQRRWRTRIRALRVGDSANA